MTWNIRVEPDESSGPLLGFDWETTFDDGAFRGCESGWSSSYRRAHRKARRALRWFRREAARSARRRGDGLVA